MVQITRGNFSSKTMLKSIMNFYTAVESNEFNKNLFSTFIIVILTYINSSTPSHFTARVTRTSGKFYAPGLLSAFSFP